ncbi:uncharacterized protein LOC110842585 [Folsomia candida]|uniref:uncharacterized protein LOC110842585 n=1 Tax=Folsomia candida TaxID=158441 RepID=UPI000B90038D|nr:uncharacterized protein LOC110842585 [Folsomia candida]
MSLDGLRSKITVTVLGQCIVCEEVTTLRCQSCLKGGKEADEIPFYCSRDHQSKHWKAGHKANCGQLPKKPLGWKLEHGPCTLSQNVPEGISYFVATEDLEPGHVLFQRKPLLAFPAIPSPQDFNNFLEKMPPSVKTKMLNSEDRLVWTCVGCYEVLVYGEVTQTIATGLMVNKCVQCGWPLHSNIHPKYGPTKCQAVHEEECKILMERGLTWETLQKEKLYRDPEFYYHLGLLRAVMLPPQLKEELMNLPVFIPAYFRFFNLKLAIPFVRERCGMGDKVGEEEAQKILEVLFGNILGPPIQHSTSKNKLAFIVYAGGPTGRVMTHDCTPNCYPYIGKDLTATFKTIRKVAAGELLTINYIMISNHCKTVDERLTLFTQLLLPPCRCARCQSSTEDGTYFSAIKCPADKKTGDGKRECQYLLPMPNPNHTQGFKDIFIWKCACTACTGATRQSAVEQLVSTIKEKIQTATRSPNAYDELKSIVARNSGRTVHPDHAVILYALLNIAATAFRHITNVQANKDPAFSFNLHKKYMTDFNIVLEKMQVIQPGRSDHYGLLLFGQTLLRMSELAENVLESQSKPSLEDLDTKLTLILSALKESWTIINANQIAEPYDTARESRLRKFYANHLISSIRKGMGEDCLDKVSSVKKLKEKYFSEVPVNLDMSEKELEYRELLVIDETVPNLIKKMEEHGIV